MMKKVLLALTIVFFVLTFVGAGYVLYTGGEANPGFGVIPSLFCIICSNAYAHMKKKNKEDS